MIVVLEGQARAGVDEAIADGVEIVHAPGEADDTITALAAEYREVVVVTADRQLAERVDAANVTRTGCSGDPHWARWCCWTTIVVDGRVRSVVEDVLELEMEELDWRSAFTGLIGLLIALVFIGVFGTVGMAAGIAVVFVVGSDEEAHKGPDLGQLLLVPVGAIVTYAVGESTTSTAGAAIVIGLITLGCTLLLLLGTRFASIGAYSLMWAVLALTIGVTDESAAEMAIAFAAGGTIALAVLFVSSRIGDGGGVETVDDDPASSDPGMDERHANAIITFAVVRSLAAALAVAIGFEWFPEHAAWTVLTFVLVLRPPKEQTMVVAVGRTVGTVAGVLIGMAAAQLVGDNLAAQLIAFVLAGFLMLASSDVNYALSTTFTTAMLLLSERILHEDVYQTGWERLGATVVGVMIAFLVIGVMGGIRTRQQPDTEQVTT